MPRLHGLECFRVLIEHVTRERLLKIRGYELKTINPIRMECVMGILGAARTHMTQVIMGTIMVPIDPCFLN